MVDWPFDECPACLLISGRMARKLPRESRWMFTFIPENLLDSGRRSVECPQEKSMGIFHFLIGLKTIPFIVLQRTHFGECREGETGESDVAPLSSI
jgi:hypothetical protein